MQPYPHTYVAAAGGAPSGSVPVTAEGLPTLSTAPPREFDGPGDLWSPETLLCAAVANCFILTFRSIARASKLEWLHLACRVEGTLERGESGTQFTRFITHAELKVPAGANPEQGRRLLEKAEHSCLVANSLRGARRLETHVITATDPAYP